ncbi:glutamine synthetase family protein [Arcanobacterium pinnipediorum]|uniref:Glutamine synthetase family protein n=1 Tax=Arcanobacterium pinnipediorum TaxID=1503041 RepID=A0ABY5AIR7_9ACTO|nr:glutamine synthetase family protein [Arcanobacterium pinnipediorum]USR80088.1 glutamine synthetase family protein [Arcanobacterium pinnipediorum]
MDTQQEHVIATVEEQKVRFIRLWFTDVTGTLKSVAIPPAELENAFSSGIGFDGSAIEGLSRVHEADMVIKPDASTFQILPWDESGEPCARMFCDIHTPDNQPARSDPRGVLRRALQRAAQAGFTFHVHPEVEFYLFQRQTHTNGDPIPIDNGSYFDHVSRPLAQSFRAQAVRELEQMGIPVEFSHHEAGPGQNEIDLRVADALTTADNLMSLRTVVEHVAITQGVEASFMPKPLIDQPGNGLHIHMSLFEGETNSFFDPLNDYSLSEIGTKFVAGILHHSREISAVTNQHINSYKRLWAGDEAPAYIAWGKNNRSALIRVPSFTSTEGHSARIEYRALDSAVNPYLAFAVILNAGLAGIEHDYEVPESIDTNINALSARERQIMGIEELPTSLHSAIKLAQKSELIASTLGEDAFDYFLRNKLREWNDYRQQITAFERKVQY